MGKHTVLKAATVLIIVGLVSYLAWDNTKQIQPAQKRFLPAVSTYQTTSTRTSNLGKYCPSTVDRTTLVTTAEISTATSNRQAISSQLGIDGNKLMNKLAKGNTGDAMTMITSNAANIGIFIGVFLLPFIIFLWIWPFLCCCCCCPSCCPSKCCQKAQNELYTKCQLYWPAVTLILALLLILSTSIYGFVNASNIGPSFTNMGCSLAIFTDDLLNGNVTADNKTFFTGLYMFSSKLTDLNGNLSVMTTHLGDLNNTASGTTYTQVSNVQTVINTNVKVIPDGAGTANMAITYNTPINSAAATANNLASNYASILGKWDTNVTLMSKLYNSIYNAYYQMMVIKVSANVFVSQQGTISTQLTPMRTNIDNLATNVKDMDSQLGGFLSILKTPGDFGNMGMQGFYGFLICFSFFTMVGALLTVCCDKPGCRHLMYFSCIFLFIGALLAFFVAVLFSFFVPFFTWTCDYINTAVSSDAGFKDNFGAFLSNTTVDQISVCMPYGDGKIVSKVAGTAADAINNLTSVITSLQTFSNTTLRSYITGNLTQITDSVNSYANGDISDLDTTNNDILKGFSYPSNTTYNPSCNSAFSSDSWVPSNNQNYSYSTAISCQVSSGTANISNCDSSLATNSTSSCLGCMHTTQLLGLYSSASTLRTALDGRYTSSCAFNPYLQNAWTNYFSKKFAVLGKPTAYTQVAGTVLYRLQTATTSITGSGSSSVFTNLDNFKQHLTYAKGNLSAIGDLTDPTYGMLAGLNCRIFGEDFVTFQNVICGSFYNNMFIIRLTFGIAAWGILFSMCCIVCTGVRHFKQIDKLKKIGDNMGGQEVQQTKAELRAKN